MVGSCELSNQMCGCGCRLVDKGEDEIQAEETQFQEDMEERWRGTLKGRMGYAATEQWKAQYRRLHHPDFHSQIHLSTPVVEEQATLAVTLDAAVDYKPFVATSSGLPSVGIDFDPDTWQIVKIGTR
jgi:hypothetical protein